MTDSDGVGDGSLDLAAFDRDAGDGCGSTCCGFACHAYQLAVGLKVAGPIGRPADQPTVQDEQVGSGMPSFIERPPRSV